MKQTAIGYIRISTDKQETQAQASAITEAVARSDMKLERLVEETVSSRKKERQVFGLIEELKAGQVLVCYELSRLGRSLTEILNIVEAVKRRKASIWILSPDMKLGSGLSSGQEIQAETMIFALGLGSRIERDLISERTKNALRERRSQGVTLGRPKGRGKKVEKAIASKGIEIEKFIEVGLSAVKIGKLLGVDRRTVTDYLNSKKQVKQDEKKRDRKQA